MIAGTPLGLHATIYSMYTHTLVTTDHINKKPFSSNTLHHTVGDTTTGSYQHQVTVVTCSSADDHVTTCAHTPFLRKNRSPSLYPWWNSSSSWLQDVGHNAFVRRTIFFALICSGWSEMLTMCGEADSPWGQMSQSPLNGDTEMTSGSELKGMLLVKPPSQHRCRKEGRKGLI